MKNLDIVMNQYKDDLETLFAFVLKQEMRIQELEEINTTREKAHADFAQFMRNR